MSDAGRAALADGASGRGASARSAEIAGLLSKLGDRARAEGAATAPTIHTLHHFACTGGTLISRCIAALPNVRMLSEIDPISPLGPKTPSFRPTDLLTLARLGPRPPARRALIEAFLAGLGALHADARRGGFDLVLRDHAHGHFCVGPELAERPTLLEMVAERHAVRAAVTVRHPLDSYLSLREQGWVHFAPKTLEEYARRYNAFLDRYAGVPTLRYEDFVADPETGLARLADWLGLSRDSGALGRHHHVRLSGDSGRGGGPIAPRPRRAVPEGVAAEARVSAAFSRLLERLGYD